MNATDSTTNSAEEQLHAILQRIVAEIDDPQCHYWLYANYFDVQRGGSPSPTDRRTVRWGMTPLFLNHDALWNPEFVEDGLLIDVILKNQLPAEKERIKIRYDQIWCVKRTHFGELRRSETDSNVYYQSEADSLVYHQSEKRQFPKTVNGHASPD